MAADWPAQRLRVDLSQEVGDLSIHPGPGRLAFEQKVIVAVQGDEARALDSGGELDPYNHVSTGKYATHYVDHRMEGLRNHVGWNLTTLATLPFMVWVRRMEIDFLRPARGDQEITITSFVREFRGPNALIECTMIDSAGKNVSRCLMTVAHVDRATNRATDWPPDLMALFFETEAA